MKPKKRYRPFSYFEKRLKAFLNERHPDRCGDSLFIEQKCHQAETAYRRSILEGDCVAVALARSDEVLFGGLLFSKYDTL